jgi:UDP-N-acetylglucosamine--N-acetylmuramyl-(pentapeptide) pyrophosphoryl-undecaprenol N-acetylglucosamine transferase
VTFVIAAAGTGGHVYPALAIAEAMVGAGRSRDEIVVFGGRRKAETAASDAGFGFVGFELAKLRRSFTPSNLAIPIVLRRTVKAMAAELERRETRAVLGMSGYVTVPAALAARRMGIPFFLHEQNAKPGLAARFASRRARRTFLGLPGRAERLPRSELVGNPLRPELQAFERARLRPEALARYDLPSESVVVGILGGSLGAKVLNEAAAGIAGHAPDGTALVHLTGEARAGASAERDSRLPWRQLAYEDRMDLFFAACDLVVCRAGAMTVSEIAATRTPAVFVPLESVGQQFNAAALGDGAIVVRQDDAGSLPGLVAALVDDPGRRARMTNASGPIGEPDPAGAVAEALLQVAAS